VVRAEGEIRGVLLLESGAVRAGAGIDAAAGNVAPRHAGVGAGLRDGAGKDGVAEQALGFVQLAGIDVGFAGVACGVDQEFGLILQQGGPQDVDVGVVQIGAAQVAKGIPLRVSSA
jgi:hypothetical protein